MNVLLNPSPCATLVDEAHLICRAKRGDTKAFGTLVSQHRDQLIRSLRGRTRCSYDDAEDIAQDACVRAWDHIDTLKEGVSFMAWLNRIALNRFVDVQRRERRITKLELDRPSEEGGDLREVPCSRPNPHDELALSEFQMRVRTDLAMIDAIFRRPARMRYIEEQSYDEIAEELDLPLGTVKSRVNRARDYIARDLLPYVLPA